MAVVLEGWCELNQSRSLFSEVTSFNADYVSESLGLYICAPISGTAYRIQSYTNSAWSSSSITLAGPIPRSYQLYLVRTSDFSENFYPLRGNEERFEELALGKYICNIETLNTAYYWEPVATPLSTPTGLYADNITSDSARISWNAVENATDYKVEYRKQGDTTWNE